MIWQTKRRKIRSKIHIYRLSPFVKYFDISPSKAFISGKYIGLCDGDASSRAHIYLYIHTSTKVVKYENNPTHIGRDVHKIIWRFSPCVSLYGVLRIFVLRRPHPNTRYPRKIGIFSRSSRTNDPINVQHENDSDWWAINLIKLWIHRRYKWGKLKVLCEKIINYYLCGRFSLQTLFIKRLPRSFIFFLPFSVWKKSICIILRLFLLLCMCV